MEILYQVIWHEENQTGVPEHVMGASPLLPTEQAAKDWLDSTMAEDRERAGENEEALFAENLGDGVWKTAGNSQHCFYRIETVERRDEAAELLEKADACIDDLNRIAHETVDGAACPAAVTRRILDYYRETGTKTFRVDLRCSPCVCVRVQARTAEEAETIVYDRLDDGTLVLTAEQKNGVINDILENVETVEAEEDT